MLERLTRFRDLDGMPKVEMSTPFEYFKKVKSTADDIPTWVGELVRDKAVNHVIGQIIYFLF